MKITMKQLRDRAKELGAKIKNAAVTLNGQRAYHLIDHDETNPFALLLKDDLIEILYL